MAVVEYARRGTASGTWYRKVTTQKAYSIRDEVAIAAATSALEDIEAGRSTVYLSEEEMFRDFGLEEAN